MERTRSNIADILRKAIKGEEDGYRFYHLLSEKATNADARRKLENLRDDERRHRDTLVGIFDKYVGGEIGPLPAHGIGALYKVFERAAARERRSEMEFITLAIEAELAATKYYQDERNVVDDPAFRDIFDQLAAEEHRHFELLQAEKEALAGNYHWFAYGDGAPLED